MIRAYMMAGLLLIAAGCAKSDNVPRRAHRAKAGLMPAPAPQFDRTYVADQTQVKLLAEREVSYEPLESFRGSGGGAVTARRPVADRSARPRVPRAPSGPAPAVSGGFWKRIASKAVIQATGGMAVTPEGDKDAPDDSGAPDDLDEGSDEFDSEEEAFDTDEEL